MPATINAPNVNDNGLAAAVVPQQNLLETALKAYWSYVYPFRWIYAISVVVFFFAALSFFFFILENIYWLFFLYFNFFYCFCIIYI